MFQISASNDSFVQLLLMILFLDSILCADYLLPYFESLPNLFLSKIKPTLIWCFSSGSCQSLTDNSIKKVIFKDTFLTKNN